MKKFEEFLSQEIKINGEAMARNVYVASLSMFIFTCMFTSLFSVAYGNELNKTAAVYNSNIENQIQRKEVMRENMAAGVGVMQVVTFEDVKVKVEKPELVFTVSSTSVKTGDSVKINWTAKNASKCELMQNNKIISSAVKGDIASDPVTEADVIWISCSNDGGNVVASSQVSIK